MNIKNINSVHFMNVVMNIILEEIMTAENLIFMTTTPSTFRYRTRHALITLKFGNPTIVVRTTFTLVELETKVLVLGSLCVDLFRDLYDTVSCMERKGKVATLYVGRSLGWFQGRMGRDRTIGLSNAIHVTAGRKQVVFPFKDVKEFPDVFYRAQCFGFGSHSTE